LHRAWRDRRGQYGAQSGAEDAGVGGRARGGGVMTPSRKLLACMCTLALGAARGARAQTTDTLRAAGVARPVEIMRDHWGIAHIYAGNEHDLFFAQGYVAARDRLFQLELWRRQATGTVAELLGARELPRDIGARLFAYRGDLARELAHYHPHGAAILRA